MIGLALYICLLCGISQMDIRKYSANDLTALRIKSVPLPEHAKTVIEAKICMPTPNDQLRRTRRGRRGGKNTY